MHVLPSLLPPVTNIFKCQSAIIPFHTMSSRYNNYTYRILYELSRKRTGINCL